MASSTRINGIGNLDWNFPDPIYSHRSGEFYVWVLLFKLQLDKPVPSIGITLRYEKGTLTYSGPELSQRGQGVPIALRQMAAELSVRYSAEVVLELWQNDPKLATLKVQIPMKDREDDQFEGILHPTKFLLALVRKMNAWARKSA